MRRILTVLTVALVMAALMAVMASSAFAMRVIHHKRMKAYSVNLWTGIVEPASRAFDTGASQEPKRSHLEK